MAHHSVDRQVPQNPAAVGKAARKTDAEGHGTKAAPTAVAEEHTTATVADADGRRGARILVLTDDPHRSVVIVPGCHLDSMGEEGESDNAYFFEDGNELVGMIVEGGTVEYRSADRTYVVRLADGMHGAD